MTTSISHFDYREGLLALLTAPGRYPVEVKDDSMSEAGIYRGDTVVVQSQEHACSGDIVIVLVDNEDVLIKRIRFPDRNRIQLRSENVDTPDLLLEKSRVVIQGKVIGQIRRYP